MDKTCVVITTIQTSESNILQNIASGAKQSGYGLVIAGDRKSPTSFDLSYGDYLNIESQNNCGFNLTALLPENTYARKNVGYLYAIRNGFTSILETDDDNDPFESFWKKRKSNVTGNMYSNKGWLNVYSFFSDKKIWPRGFLLKEINQSNVIIPEQTTSFCPIQQGLVNGDPDVDAIYRLTNKEEFYFKNASDIILNHQVICPFNSQNTLWFKFAFPLLYLPSYCSFRMTDIWRSFIAQRILWTCKANIAFYSPTVKQYRNQHDIMNDFQKELNGYLRNEEFMNILLALELNLGEEYMSENLYKCYERLIKEGFFEVNELKLLEEWLKDIQELSLNR